MDRDYTFTGDNLQARFGHTITPIEKQRAIIFGGAIGDSAAKYTITGDTFLCDFVHRKIKKLEPRGNIPSNRAAHAAISIDNNFFIFGGALGGGQLADNNLYFLDVNSITDKALWGLKNCRGLSPSSRYGHVMGYIKPFLIIHGGNTGAESVSEVWVNDVINHFQWKKVDVGGDNPAPRVYHSASMCKTGTASGMLVIFGGRGSDGSPLSDTWGLRKHKDGRIDWMKAPYRSGSIKPTERYQHRTLFIGTLFLVIGGRNSNMGEIMNLDIYDTDTSQWHRIIKLDRFRHIAFLVESNIFIHGGFEQQNPNVPTESVIKLDLNKLFSGDRALFKGLAFEMGRDIITHNSNYNSNPNSQLSRRSSIESQQVRGRRSINEMQIELPNQPRRNLNGNKQIRLCGQVFVANYNEEAEVKKINIENLQSENKKLKEPSSSISKDSSVQLITRFFLNSIFMKNSQNIQLKYPLPKDFVNIMFFALEKLFQKEPTLLRIRAPVKIFGDIHGQVHELNRLFEAFGSPTDQSSKGDIQSMNYLFLGDFVDRGATSLETLLLLFNLKLKYPENIFLIRGSHQDQLINRSMGFGDQCAAKLKQNIDDSSSFFQRSNRIFERLSLAALIDESIFCVHSGIGSNLTTLSEINKLTKPMKINHHPKTKAQKIIYDLLWSDMCRGKQANGTVNLEHDYFKTKSNYKFSEKRAEAFCAQNQLITIIKSGEPIMEGYDNNDSVVTVFSCSDYGNYGNKCSIMVVNKNQQLMPMILGPITTKDRWMEGLDKKKPTSTQDAALRSLSFTPPK